MDSEALAAAISEWRERRATMREEDDERLWRKLRLEWNYNSNHIEGNTLSYHETELLLIHGRTAGGHPMRHYEEMKAHDVAIDHTRSLASAERVLGEGDIRDLNKILLKEPFWHIAQTPDGQQTRKRIVPGEYKTQPNHVRTMTGELHRFAEPEETPALMERWTRGFQRDLARTADPLPLFLAKSHWSFLRIHPFDDGNGRTARCSQLRPAQVPPCRHCDKPSGGPLLGALQNADVVQWALCGGSAGKRPVVRCAAIGAAKGESIREARDSERDCFVTSDARAGEPKASDVEMLEDVVSQRIRPTLNRVKRALEPLHQLFADSNWLSFVKRSRGGGVEGGDLLGSRLWESTKKTHVVMPGFRLSDEQGLKLGSRSLWRHYTGRGGKAFSLELSLIWEFDEEGVLFSVEIDGRVIVRSRVGYAEVLAHGAETDRTVDIISQAMMAEIARRLGKED